MLRLKFERTRRGLSQGCLAELASLTQPQVCLIEQGRLLPTPDQLDRLAQVLGIAPALVLLKELTVQDPDEVEQPV